MVRRRRLAVAVCVVAAAVGLGWRQWFAGGPPSAPLPIAAPTISAAPAQSPVADTEPARDTVVETAAHLRVHLHRPRPLRVPEPPYAAAYAALLPRAEAGDSGAQYQLGLLLYECRDVPASPAALQERLESYAQTRRNGAWTIVDLDAESAALRARYGFCEGVPTAARGDYRQWLKSAADAGLLEAELDLPRHLPPGDYCQFWYQCSETQRGAQEALQREALDYIGRARDAGSADALWQLGEWYAEGEVVPADDGTAYAYFYALDQIYAAAGNSRRFTAILDDLGGRLRPIDRELAEKQARDLLDNPNCCVLSP